MRTAEKEILRGVLGRMAAEAPEPVPFEQLDTVLLYPEALRRERWLTGRPVWVVAVAATAVLLFGVGATWLTNTGNDNIHLADGETLISADPPIVQGAESPEPVFDTRGLGDEVPLAPVTDIQKIVDTATTLQTGDRGEVVRITVLGETPEGVLALIVHTEGMHPRCLVTTLGGAVCRDLPAMPELGPSYTVGEGPNTSSLIWEVEAETSIATLTVNGETIWQRPVADVAVFVTDLRYGERIELTALDAEGNILVSVSRLPSHPDE